MEDVMHVACSTFGRHEVFMHIFGRRPDATYKTLAKNIIKTDNVTWRELETFVSRQRPVVGAAEGCNETFDSLQRSKLFE
jgi:hypothetical protein